MTRQPASAAKDATTAAPRRATRRRSLPDPGRRALIARLWTSAGQHLAGLEAQIEAGDTGSIGRDLASLAKVLRDLAALDAGAAEAAPAVAPPDAAALREKIRARLLRLHEGEALA